MTQQGQTTQQMQQGYSQPMQQQQAQQTIVQQKPQRTKVQRLSDALNTPEGMLEVMKRCGGDKEKANTFKSSLVDLFAQDSELQKCELKDVIQEALKAANLNLPLIKSLGLSWLVPRNVGIKQPDGTKKWKVIPCFQIGYQGWKKMALNTGEMEFLNADKVYEGEFVRFNKLKGTIELDANRRISNNIIGYFAHFETLKGYKHSEYMTIDEMCEYAKTWGQVPKDTSVADLKNIALQDKATKSMGWVGNFTAMAKKTVLTRLIKGWADIATEPRLMMAIESDVEDVSNEYEETNASRQQAETINLNSDMYQEIPNAATMQSEEPLPTELTEPQF